MFYFSLASAAGPGQEEPEQSDGGGRAGGQVRPPERAGSQPRPDLQARSDREEEGEEGQPDAGKRREARRVSGPCQMPGFLARERTKAMTVFARAGGISRGLSIRSVRPVAR